MLLMAACVMIQHIRRFQCNAGCWPGNTAWKPAESAATRRKARPRSLKQQLEWERIRNGKHPSSEWRWCNNRIQSYSWTLQFYYLEGALCLQFTVDLKFGSSPGKPVCIDCSQGKCSESPSCEHLASVLFMLVSRFDWHLGKAVAFASQIRCLQAGQHACQEGMRTSNKQTKQGACQATSLANVPGFNCKCIWGAAAAAE